MTAPVDPAHVDRLVREIVQRDRVEPGFAKALVLALIAKIGPGVVVKPPPRSSADGLDINCLIG